MAQPRVSSYGPTGGDIVNSVKIARAVKQTFGSNSITRRAQDSIMQFPVIMSGGIPLDDAVILTKALEMQYASMLMSVISCNSDYNRGKYANPVDYLKTFHNNSNIPTIFMSMDSEIPEDGTYSIESAVTLHSLENLVSSEVVMECWGDNMEKYTNTSLNSMYRPHAHTQEVMESVVSSIRKMERPALEGSSDDLDALFGCATAGRPDKNSYGSNKTGKPDIRKTTEKKVPRVGPNGKPMKDKKGNVIYDTVRTHEDPVRSNAITGVQSLAPYNDKLGALAPTLINLQLNSHHGNGPVITHNVVMGVKAMGRMISQDLMISNLVEATNDTRGIFKFIQWTEGNYSLIKDLIFGVEKAKANAAADRDVAKWITAIQRRKGADLLGKFTSGQGMPPFTTIICTNYDAARVQEETGVDLNEAYSAVKLISKYYLLSFIIYDPETGQLKAIFEGDSDYSVTSIGALKTKAQKDQDLLTYSKFIRAAGRM